MDINLVITILLTLFIVGFSLHKSISEKSKEERNQKSYDLIKKLDQDLSECVSDEETQAVVATFIFKSSAFIKDAENVERVGTSNIKSGSIIKSKP